MKFSNQRVTNKNQMKKMKTSNKLIIAVFLLILGCLFNYDLLLKSEYISGRYKNPFRDFATLKFKDFDAVDVNSTNAANVKFVQGPFSVRVNADALSFITIKQDGNRLKVNVSFERDYVQNPEPYLVIISCPILTEVNANAAFKARNKEITDTVFRDEWRMRQNLIEGFKEDSLSIRQTYGSSIILSGNHIRVLNAMVGLSPKSFSRVVILNNNLFQNVTVDILNRSRFFLDGKSILNLKYHLADSAKMMLTGNAQNIINNSKSR
jgi:hypothetical protein